MLSGGKDMGFRIRQTWAEGLAAPFPSCVSLGESPKFSEPHVPSKKGIIVAVRVEAHLTHASHCSKHFHVFTHLILPSTSVRKLHFTNEETEHRELKYLAWVIGNLACGGAGTEPGRPTSGPGGS